MQSLKPTLGARLYDMQCKVVALPGTVRLAARQLGQAHAVLLAGISVAAALVFLGLSQRYMVAQGFAGHPVRVDRLTGAVEICLARARATPRGELNEYGNHLSYECGPELEK